MKILVLMLMVVPGLFGQQCKQPSDCTSPHAPHCSRCCIGTQTFEIQVVSKKSCWLNHGLIFHYQKWVLLGQMLPCTSLGSIRSCLVLVRNNQIQFETGSLKGQYKWLLGGDACYIALRILSVTFFETPYILRQSVKCSHVQHWKENRPMTIEAVFLFGAGRPVKTNHSAF